MNTRLDMQWQRLYGGPEAVQEGAVRVMMLELARPADWDAMRSVWQGVQEDGADGADGALPAPAIAVSGVDGYQLWFSVAAPVPMPAAARFLNGLCVRYLHTVAHPRLRLWPTADPMQAQAPLPRIPACAVPGQWSAFVTPDLARIFAEDPWLNQAPNPNAQADVLAGLHPMTVADFQRVLQGMPPQAPAHPATTAELATSAPPPSLLCTPERLTGGGTDDPHAFLLRVMNDATADMRWRIQAAQALLPYTSHSPHPRGRDSP